MKTHPGKAALGFLVLGVAFAALSGALDNHGNWGDIRQAAANISWMLFLACVAGLVIDGVMAATGRWKHPAA